MTMFLLHLIKPSWLLKTVLRTLVLMTQVSLYLFSLSRTNLELHNISLPPKMVKKVIVNIHSSKVSDPDCIAVVVLKNCQPKLSYILTDLFKMCLKGSSLPDCWKVSLVVPVFKNVWENNHPVSLLLWSVKSLKNL